MSSCCCLRGQMCVVSGRVTAVSSGGEWESTKPPQLGQHKWCDVANRKQMRVWKEINVCSPCVKPMPTVHSLWASKYGICSNDIIINAIISTHCHHAVESKRIMLNFTVNSGVRKGDIWRQRHRNRATLCATGYDSVLEMYGRDNLMFDSWLCP